MTPYLKFREQNHSFYECLTSDKNKWIKLHKLLQKDFAVQLGLPKRSVRIKFFQMSKLDDFIISICVSKKNFEKRRKDNFSMFPNENSFSCFVYGLIRGYSK